MEGEENLGKNKKKPLDALEAMKELKELIGQKKEDGKGIHFSNSKDTSKELKREKAETKKRWLKEDKEEKKDTDDEGFIDPENDDLL